MSPSRTCLCCGNPIEPGRARVPQTKYCRDCAKRLKNIQSSRSRSPGSNLRHQRTFRARHPGYNNLYVHRYRANRNEARETSLCESRSGTSVPGT